MYYNFNVYLGRKMFNLNFAAKDDKDAVAHAVRLIPNLTRLRWVLWFSPGDNADWKKGIENRPARKAKAS